ncbi:MAG: DUF5018 domain-containing protein [Marinilabiliales bacterium]|nr:DUF5018 domain-containing protein [Marinilabiliales bacterium]
MSAILSTRKEISKGVLLLTVLLVGLTFLMACSKGGSPIVETKKSSEKSLLSFGFSKADNPSIPDDVTGSISGTNVTVSLPESATLNALKATFSTSARSVVKIGSTIQVDRQTANDFTSPITLTVVAEDGTQQNYTVTVKLSSKAFLSFGFFKGDNSSLTEDCPGLINGFNISVVVSSAADLTSLKATFTVTNKAVVKIGDAVQQSKQTVNNFGSVLVFSVIAEDGSKQDYAVTVVKKSSEKAILTFGLYKSDNPILPANVQGTITDGKVSLVVPYHTDLTSLKVYFTNSAKSVVKVGSTEQQSGKNIHDYSAPVVFTVTAEDGSSAQYTVTVSWAPNTAKQLISFAFVRSLNPILPYDVTGVIDSVSRKVVCIMPASVSRSGLIATFTLSERATAKIGQLEQVSGTTSNNFGISVAYLVTAQDGTTSSYAVEIRNEVPPVINQSRIDTKVLALNLHIFPWNQQVRFPGIDVVPVVSTAFLSQKPVSSMPFDAGYLGNDGKIYVTPPFTSEQKAIFRDATDAAVYYVCQAFLNHYYGTSQMPIWFKFGMAAFEADLNISDGDIKSAIQLYGGQLPSLTSLNDPVKFAGNKGINIAYMWGEFMSISKNWHYYDILSVNSQTIAVAPYWSFAPLDNLYAVWNRYVNYRILEPTDSKRGRMLRKTAHFRYYSAPKDSFCVAGFEEILSKAYAEYSTELNISFPERLDIGFSPECEGAVIDGIPCPGRYTGGTGFVSGISVSSPNTLSDLSLWNHLLRHEFAHSVVFRLYPNGYQPTAWFSEGAAEFLSKGPFDATLIAQSKSQVQEAMRIATSSFGHRPTYENSKTYPSNPYYDYYVLGHTLLDFIYKKGGYTAVRAVLSDAESGIRSLGYADHDAFMDGYYAYYDSVWK